MHDPSKKVILHDYSQTCTQMYNLSHFYMQSTQKLIACKYAIDKIDNGTYRWMKSFIDLCTD